MKNWNELSITDKNDIIKVAVQNGITTLPDIRERYNEFAEGGEEETVERVLPEIVKRPSEEDRLSLAKIKRMLPDVESRSDMYYELDPFRHLADEPIKISQNESIDRLYDVYKQSGHPKVSNHRTIFDYLAYPFSKDLNRPSYDPITNTMHLPSSEEAKYDAEGFIPELAHAYQFYGNNAHFWRDLFHIPGDVKVGGKSGYERPGHMEHTAHSVIEPAIFDYVQGHTDSFNPVMYDGGGKIHIKEKNRGKFTALKKRTGHSASWFKAHGTPAQKKMAIFALNSRHWKHGDGGHLYDGESEDTQQMYTGFDWWNRAPMTDYMDIAYEPIPDNAPKSKGTPLLDTPIMVQTAPTVSTATTFGQYMPKYESTPKRELITLGATVAAPFLPSVGQYGLQAMNTFFTPSTWLNPVTGAKLLSPTVGTIADAGIQGAFAYEGLNGLYNQGRQGTLLSDPGSTFMHGLEVLPLAGLGAKGITSAVSQGIDAVNAYKNAVETRALETAIRTSNAGNPIYALERDFKKLWKNDKQRLKDIGKYILTGKRTGAKGRYNSFSTVDNPITHTPDYNTGFLTGYPVLEKDDVIDAILYGKTVAPEWGLIKTGTGENFGLHTQHIAETYPEKVRNIQVYSLDSPYYVDKSKIIEVSPRAYGAEEYQDLFRTTRYPRTEYDAAGHMEQLGLMDNGTSLNPSLIVKPEDIYAFNSKRYKSRWLEEDPYYDILPHWKKKIADYILNKVDKHVTPIVVKGPWIERQPYHKDIEKHPELYSFYTKYRSLGGPLVEMAMGGRLRR